MVCDDRAAIKQIVTFLRATTDLTECEFRPRIEDPFPTGKEKYSDVLHQDQFFEKTCELKHGGSQQFNATVFRGKEAMFERLWIVL